MLGGQLNRGSGDRTYVAFSPPVAYSLGTAALCVHTIVSGVFRVAPAYLSANKISVSLDAAMNNNGYIWVNVTYKI